MTLPKIQYSRLRFYHFVDVEDQELGTLEDIILDMNTLIPTHIILGGGFFEEFMEDKGEIEDIDEIAPLSLIDHIDNDFIVLATKLEDLETTDKNGKIPVDGYRYSKFVKCSLVDQNGPFDGEIIDYEFDGANSSIFINHLSVEQELRQKGYFQKIEFIIPIDKLEVNNQIVKIDINKDMLINEVTSQIKPKQTGKSRIVVA